MKKKTAGQKKAEEVTQGPSKVSATSKQQWNEHLGLKAKKRRWEEEEEHQEEDDEDRDPDSPPENDPEQEFVTEDTELDEEDTFKIEKHVHVINLPEADDYIVKIRQFVSCFGKVVQKSKVDVPREYRKLIHFMREMVLKIGSYGPVEHTDEEAVFRTIVDPTCTAWRRAIHSTKTGNSKDLQRIEER